MAVVFESVALATRDVDGFGLLIGKPAGTVAGDVLVAFLAADGWPTFTGPAGWTKEVVQDGFPPGARVSLAVFWLVAGAAEPASYTWSYNKSETAAGCILRYSGVDGVVTVEASAGGSGSSGTPTAPSVTTLGVERLIVYGCGSDGVQTPYAPPSGTVERVDHASVPGSPGVSNSVADKLLPGAGASGVGVFTQASSIEWRAGTLALIPSAAAAVAGAGAVVGRAADFVEDWGRGSFFGNQ